MASLAVALLLASTVEAQLGQGRGVQRRGYNQRARIATGQAFRWNAAIPKAVPGRSGG